MEVITINLPYEAEGYGVETELTLDELGRNQVVDVSGNDGRARRPVFVSTPEESALLVRDARTDTYDLFRVSGTTPNTIYMESSRMRVSEESTLAKTMKEMENDPVYQKKG